MRQHGDIPELISALQAGDRRVLDQLLPRVYEELKTIAHRQLSRERQDHTLNTTALVHEAYLRLSASEAIRCVDRTHFFAIAARAMRRILIDYAVQRQALKRGGRSTRVALDDVPLLADEQSRDLLDLEDALRRLERIDERQVRIVECRYFGGMSIDETARALDVSAATVKRDWNMARAWLNRELAV